MGYSRPGRQIGGWIRSSYQISNDFKSFVDSNSQNNSPDAKLRLTT